MTDGTVMKISADHVAWCIATPTEHFTALSFNMHPCKDNICPASKLAATLAALRPSQAKMLAGNAMHLVTQCAWMLYVLSNIVRVCDGALVPRMLTSTSWEVLENDDDNDIKKALC